MIYGVKVNQSEISDSFSVIYPQLTKKQTPDMLQRICSCLNLTSVKAVDSYVIGYSQNRLGNADRNQMQNYVRDKINMIIRNPQLDYYRE